MYNRMYVFDTHKFYKEFMYAKNLVYFLEIMLKIFNINLVKVK